jgi:hypothetical protein
MTQARTKVRATARLKAERDVAIARGSFLSAKRHAPIPFPSRSVVGRERLAPYRTIGIRFVPLKHADEKVEIVVRGSSRWNNYQIAS